MTGLAAGVLFAGVAALANVAGGALVLLSRTWSRRGLKASLAFGGGFMLAAAVLGMVPESLHCLSRCCFSRGPCHQGKLELQRHLSWRTLPLGIGLFEALHQCLCPPVRHSCVLP